MSCPRAGCGKSARPVHFVAVDRLYAVGRYENRGPCQRRGALGTARRGRGDASPTYEGLPDAAVPSTRDAVCLREANWYATRRVGASEVIQISANLGECGSAAVSFSNDLARFAGLYWRRKGEEVNCRQTEASNRMENAAMAPQTLTSPQQNQTVEDKIQQLRQLYADTPQFARTA